MKVGELMETVARYLGEERSRRSFERFAAEAERALDPKAAADLHMLRFSEQLLASAIGAASARLVLSLLLNRDDPTPADAQRLLDDAEQALHYNRDLLQTVLDRVDQGIAAFDRELRLVCWNRLFRQHLDLPPEFGQVGTLAARDPAPSRRSRPVRRRRSGGARRPAHRRSSPAGAGRARERHPGTGRILTLEPRRSGDGGLALVVTDVTEQAESEAELVRSKAMLEKRVAERTEELTRLNEALERATAAAEEANIGKTRFLAAAGHDILQPLNAARLYATALSERTAGSDEAALAGNLGTALDGVEDILRAVLDISRLDTGSLKPDSRPFRLQELLDRIARRFRRAGARQGARAHDRAVQPGGATAIRSCLRGSCRTSSPTPSNTRRAGACWSAAGASATASRSRWWIPASASRRPSRRVIFKEFRRLESGRARRAGPRPRPVDRRAHRQAARHRASRSIRCRGGARASACRCRSPPARRHRRARCAGAPLRSPPPRA